MAGPDAGGENGSARPKAQVRPAAGAGAAEAGAAEAGKPHPLSFLLTPDVLVNRLILSEVLGPPRSRRRGR